MNELIQLWPLMIPVVIVTLLFIYEGRANKKATGDLERYGLQLVYRHIKSGRLYTVIDNLVIDASDGENKKSMVLYKNENGQVFVRYYVEFYERFERVESKKPVKCQ